MARHFTRTAGDYVDLGSGSASMVDGGPSTVVILWRPTTVHSGWLIVADTGAGQSAFSINPFSDGNLWHTMVGFRTTMPYTALDGWRIDIWTKPAGAAQPVRGHSMLLSVGTWSHANYGTSDDSTNVPSVRFRVGRHPSFGDALDGDVAAMAVIQDNWLDAAIDSGSLGSGLAQWMTLIGANPAVVWAFNQALVSDPIVDITGGGGDQVAISGTSISTDPPGFNYLLTTPTDCTFDWTLPTPDVALSVNASSSSSFGWTLPTPNVAMMIGANVPPPLMIGAASTRDLVGSATVV